MLSTTDKIKAILKKETGLDINTVGESTIQKILNERMRQCKISNVDEYYAYLKNTSLELSLLLETSVIPETWFFRDDKPFSLIREKAATSTQSPCRILCLPCSTGEEPYSIAMFFNRNNITEKKYTITATDISNNSIEIAQQGIYSNNSFRGKKAKEYIDNYFTLINGGYQINKDIQSLVDFKQVNILNTETLSFENKFDFILCRNLLIYFDGETKKNAYKNLHSLLKKDGSLFIGHSEFGSVPKDIFIIRKVDSVFFLKKNTEENKKSNASTIYKNNNLDINKINPGRKKNIRSKIKPEINKNITPIKPFSSPIIPIKEDDLLEQARNKADHGRLNEAESLCLKYIDIHNDNEESFFLLGLINEASGNNEQAQKFYKKSLYLNPKHYETLIHLSLIVEREGDITGSTRLKERAERALINNNG